MKFQVHSVREVTVLADVVMNGKDIKASVPGLEVELVPVEATSSTLTLKFTADEAVAAKEFYVVDAVVKVTVSK